MSYDALPYPSLPLPQTHPERLATAATLLGMTPAPASRCRVLELGCASGGNLLPMAAAYPDSRFLGVDLSPRQIADGEATRAALGAPNLELRAADLLELVRDGGERQLGEFDYILCHGVYSWVPEPVQRAILAICGRHLAPEGVAYVSYNTYPGFYKRQPVRDLMRFHLAQGGAGPDAGLAGRNPQAAAQRARVLLDVLGTSVPNHGPGGSTWARILKDEADKLREAPDAYLFHEHLESENRPLYFHEFATAAAGHGLQYLTEAERLGSLDDLPPTLAALLGPLDDDVIRLEQYLDFVRNQSLRCTLLVRAGLPLRRQPAPEQTLSLWASCAAWPVAEPPPARPQIRSEAPVSFRSRLGQVTVPDPGFKAVLMALYHDRPAAQRFADLKGRAGGLVGDEIADDALADILLYGYRAGLINLHVEPPRLVTEVAARPLASPVARLQAATQELVANLWHQTVELSPLERRLLPLLDGTRDHEALLTALVEAVERGELAVEGMEAERRGGRSMTPAERREALKPKLRQTLRRLAVAALLVA